MIASHAGSLIKCLCVEPNDLESISKYIKDPTVDAVVIEEVQFFDDGIIEVVEKLANSKKRVIVAGLDTDFRGEPFKIMASLLAKAEFITKLSAVCSVCGAPATKTQRLIDNKPAKYDDPIILVGAAECYEARCRKCHQVVK